MGALHISRSIRTCQRGSVSTTIVVVLLALAVGAAATGGVYYWQQHKIAHLNGQITTLNTQITKQQKQQTSSTPSSPAPTTSSSPTATYVSEKGVNVMVYAPTQGAKVTSPVGVIGKVPGNWSLEATFPIHITNSAGTVVAQGRGELLDDWMTTNLVPFSAKLTFTTSVAGKGTLVLQKDNPSGNPSGDDTVSIPIEL